MRSGLSSRHPPLERSSMRPVPSGSVGPDTVVRNCTRKRGVARRSSIFMSMTDRLPTLCFSRDLNALFLEQAEGYVKALEKSTSLFSIMRRFLNTVRGTTRQIEDSERSL